MTPTSTTVSSATTSSPIPLDIKKNPFNVSVATVVSGTLTYKVQHTFDDVLDPTITATWFDHSTITGKTADQDGNYAFPVRAVRLNVTAWTSGSVSMTVIQAG